MDRAVDIRGLRFAYDPGTLVLDVPEFALERGERLFLHGPSGSGKTTFLGVLAGVLRPQSGGVTVLGRELTALSGSARDTFRAEHVGYIFQMFNLIPYLSVLENVALPCRMSRRRRARLGGRDVDDAALELARRLDIEPVLHERVSGLSVGQQQRVAAARALIGAPELVVADEPTSALDADRRATFLGLLFDCCAAAGATLVFVSHDRGLETHFTRGVSLLDLNRAAAPRRAGNAACS